jgi:hypothetical protein
LRDQLVRGGFGFHEPREAQISTLLLCGTAATLTAVKLCTSDLMRRLGSTRITACALRQQVGCLS